MSAKSMRIAVTSRSFSAHAVLRSELLDRYDTVTFNQAGDTLRGEALIAFLRGHDRAITALEPLDEGVFSAIPELRVVAKFGIGTDMLDLSAMSGRGIRLGWAAGVNKRAVSELVISATIALLRHIPEANRQVRAGTFQQIKGRQLSGRTVGIIGCGNVGKDLAVLLRAFDCRLLAHDILDFPEFYATHGVEPVGLEELLAQADVVSVHLPLNRSTRNMLGAKRLALMKPDAVLVNTARGGIIDEAALKEMLRDGRLAGAAFDVFEPEPPADAELLNLSNFLATPHIGGSTEEAILTMGRAAIRGLEENRVPDGDWPG